MGSTQSDSITRHDYDLADRFKRHTPDHGRFPGGPFGSGNIAKNRSSSGRRPNFAAVFMVDRTSAARQPYGSKKAGPCSGPNLSGAPASLKGLPMLFCSIRSTPGEARSVIHD